MSLTFLNIFSKIERLFKKIFFGYRYHFLFVMAQIPPRSRCTYPLCPWFPEPLIQKCKKCQTRLLHHLCQIDYETIHCKPFNIDLGLLHNCYPCISDVIAREKKRLRIQDRNIPPKPPLLAQSPVQRLLTPPPGNESSKSIPTNVRPERLDFEPPNEIATVDRPAQNPPSTQKGFKGNSGVFCVDIIHYGKARSSSTATDKFGYGKIVGVPNKKNNIDHYSIQ